MIDQEAAMQAVPPEDELIVAGVAGETPTHWVIERDPIYEPEDDRYSAITLDLPIPLVHKQTGEVTYALPVTSPELFEGFKTSDSTS